MKSLRSLIPYFRKHKGRYLWGLLFVVISCTFAAFAPRIIGNAVNDIEKGTATTSSLLEKGLLIIGLSAAGGYLFYLVRQFIIVASRDIEYDLRNDFLAHIQTLSMRFFQNTPPGEVMAYATNDINAVRNFLGPAIMYSADTLLTFVLSLTFMMMISPGITLAVLAPLPLMSLGVYLIGRRVAPLTDAVQGHYADMSSRVTESISGTKVIKAYVREEYEQSIFDKLSEDYYKKNMRLVKVQGFMMPVIFGFMGMSVIILLLLGGPRMIEGTLSLGEMTQFVIYLGMLGWPFIALGWVTNMVQRSEASMARLNIIFDTKPDVFDGVEINKDITKISGKIDFRNVSFKYREELPYVLNHVDLHIPQGKSLAIVGKTGSGKSSLITLLPRLYDITGGNIYIDGHDIKTIPLEVLRENIGYVTQEAFLFSESIRDNIAFGIRDATDDQIIEAARLAEIHTDISEFPLGYETIVGERGITLSGGQKQRTSLARALARNPKILILDDAMSAVDTHTEERILSNLREVMKGRTSILISHRISTVKDADEIVVIDEGKIKERGTHEMLLSLQGWYHDLYRKQLLEEALEEA
jgi:ATP-binding cassette subfamily B multidrug efflux pump